MQSGLNAAKQRRFHAGKVQWLHKNQQMQYFYEDYRSIEFDELVTMLSREIPEDDREVFLIHFLAGWPQKEVAVIEFDRDAR